MLKINLNKIAAILAFIIGAMAVFAGGRVLLGSDPGYYVINWLVLYNYTVGILTVFVVATLIWSDSKLALPAAIGVLCVHALVMIILLAGYREVVATDSLVAMTVRLVIWLIILGLMFLQRRKEKAEQPSMKPAGLPG